MIVGFLYGGISWLGVPPDGLLACRELQSGPWSSDPEADQNVSAKERKKRRKKAKAKAAAARACKPPFNE